MNAPPLPTLREALDIAVGHMRRSLVRFPEEYGVSGYTVQCFGCGGRWDQRGRIESHNVGCEVEFVSRVRDALATPEGGVDERS